MLFDILTVNTFFESKAFRNDESVRKYSSAELGEILFAMLLTVHLLSRTKFKKEAVHYAHESVKYPTYDNIYLSTSDLGNLISTLRNAKEFLNDKNVDIPVQELKQYLRGLHSETMPAANIRALFYKMQTRLHVKDSYLLALRRDIVDNDNLSWSQKKALGDRLYQILRRQDYKVDILAILQKLMDCRDE